MRGLILTSLLTITLIGNAFCMDTIGPVFKNTQGISSSVKFVPTYDGWKDVYSEKRLRNDPEVLVSMASSKSEYAITKENVVITAEPINEDIIVSAEICDEDSCSNYSQNIKVE